MSLSRGLTFEDEIMALFAFSIASAVLLVPAEWHIDCTGWTGEGTTEFKVRITAMDGRSFTQTVQLLPGSNPATARDIVWSGLERFGWRGYTVGDGILVLRGSKKSPVRSVEFKSESWKPAVRMVPTVPRKK